MIDQIIFELIKDKLKAWAKYSLVLIGLGLVLLGTYRWLGPKVFTFQPEFMENRQDSRLFRDARGEIFWAEMTADEHWQMNVSLDEISPYFIKAVLATEDKRFYEHDGVDYIRVLRATISNIFGGRIVSGASTVSMQVVRLSGDYERNILFKIKQFAMAWSLEDQRSKEWILTQYVNNLPFGGNIRGIEAASRYYFDKSAKNLTLWEATLLAGIPQSPARLRPDRHAERCQKRQLFILYRLLKERWITRNDYEAFVPRLYIREERDEQGKNRLGLAQKEELLYHFLKSKEAGDVQTSIDLEQQQVWRKALQNYVAEFSGVEDAAMVLMDNETGELKVMIGSLDRGNSEAGQVNVALQKRSTGSTLKPFIYLCAIQEGKLLAESPVLDAPIDISGYRPENFSGQYYGALAMGEALRKSLNTPAVRVLQSVGLESFSERMSDLSKAFTMQEMKRTGLPLALGGHEMSLLELTRLYSFLARASHVTNNQSFNLGSIQLLNKILSDQNLDTLKDYQIAWKTGTSNGFKDAWCMAYDTRYTVGLWFGNKSGKANENLVGSKIAVLFMSQVFQELYKDRKLQKPFSESELMTYKSKDLGKVLKPRGIIYRAGKVNKQSRDLAIIQPTAGKVYMKGEAYALKLEANKAKVRWFVNGKYQPESELQLIAGSYKIDCIDEETLKSESVNLKVR